MSNLMEKEPQMNTDGHGCSFMSKLLDGAEVEWTTLGDCNFIPPY